MDVLVSGNGTGRTSERRACLWICSDKGRKQSPRGAKKYQKGCGWTNISVSRKWDGGRDWQGTCKRCGKRQRLQAMEVNVMPSRLEAREQAERRNNSAPAYDPNTDEEGNYIGEWF